MDMKETAQTHIEDGKEKYRVGQYDAALASFDKALAVEPDNPYALFEIGKIRYVRQQYAPAVECLKRSLACLGSDRQWAKDISVLIAKAYKSLGEHHRAVTLLRQLADSGVDRTGIDDEIKMIYNDQYANLLNVADFGHDYGLLAEEYQRRLELNRSDIKSIAHLAQIYNFQGLYHLTIPLVQKNIGILPDDELFFRNKLTNELEIALRRTVVSSKVRKLTVTLSNRCNISCIMCLTSKHKWELPRARIDEIAGLFPYLEKILWQGGEVFVLDYFRGLLAAAAKHPNIRQSIVSNGQLITEAVAEELVAHNVELTLSIDGVTKDTYEYVRRGASFDTLMRNLARLNEIRAARGSNMVMNMNVAVMRANYREIRKFVEFAALHKFEFLCLMPIHTHLKTAEDIFSGPDSDAVDFLAREMKSVEQLARDLHVRLENRLPLPRQEENGGPQAVADGCRQQAGDGGYLCHIPWYQLLLDYDGTVRPDCLCPLEKSAGSLERCSIDEIWNNATMQEYRERMISKEYHDCCNANCVRGAIAKEHLKLA
jgi:MoaA/NifB/PqqE/SkfB family radical SAM enzyme